MSAGAGTVDTQAAVQERRQRWDADALQATLAAIEPGLRVEVVASTGSTNADLLTGASTLRPPPWLLVAEVQQQGRGRRGKTWHSSTEATRDASLTFSLSQVLNPTDWSGLSLAVGCALAEALDPSSDGPPRIGLKWPNDLWLIDPSAPRGGRKLGGILIETAPSPGPSQPGRTGVVGVGLNVRRGGLTTGLAPACTDLDDERFASGIAWLDELGLVDGPTPPASPSPSPHRPLGQPGSADAPLTAAWVLARVAPALAQALQRFERDGLPPFLPAFDRRDLLRGRRLAADGPNPCVGVGDGVAADGGLRLRQDDGRIAVIHGGEVSIRPLRESVPC